MKVNAKANVKTKINYKSSARNEGKLSTGIL